MWYDYFSTLLNMSNAVDETHSNRVNDFIATHNSNCQEYTRANDNTMNSDITISEVDEVISKLDCCKAPGIDDITNQCLE